MTSWINQNQVVENRVKGSGPESHISKVRLTGYAKKKKQENRKSFTFQDPSTPAKILHELFFCSMKLHLVNRCHGNCGEKLFLADKEEDYFVAKSGGGISFMNKQGEMDSKFCPLNIHFKAECLKEYARRIHHVRYKVLLFLEIMSGKDTYARLPEEVKVFPE